MDIREADTLARNLMARHLTVYGWRLQWDSAKGRLGIAKYGERVIGLSRPYAERCDREEFIDTVLHEIAHANMGAGAGHGQAWRREAIRIGGTGRVHATNAPNLRKEMAPWRGVCPNGHEATPMWRKPRVVRSCSKCCPRFNRDYLFTYTRVDTGMVAV